MQWIKAHVTWQISQQLRADNCHSRYVIMFRNGETGSLLTCCNRQYYLQLVYNNDRSWCKLKGQSSSAFSFMNAPIYAPSSTGVRPDTVNKGGWQQKITVWICINIVILRRLEDAIIFGLAGKNNRLSTSNSSREREQQPRSIFGTRQWARVQHGHIGVKTGMREVSATTHCKIKWFVHVSYRTGAC